MPDSAAPPKLYLGAKLKKKTFANGILAWSLSLTKYNQQAVRNVKAYFMKSLDGRYALLKQAKNPFPCDYAPKEDVSPLLEPSVA